MMPHTQGRRSSQQARRLAERTDHLAALVWQKAIANSSPQVRHILITFACMRQALPEPPAPFTEDHLLRLIGQAEAILTDGFNQSMIDQAAAGAYQPEPAA